ncbi:hypothetical protein HK101_009858 [Irineochytrium annulatum]|nr:hypothetical protein HK101_009858 [Irineochytrium annulatum]
MIYFNTGQKFGGDRDGGSNPGLFFASEDRPGEVWVIPAPYAFSIWGLIYSLLTGFIIVSLLPPTYTSQPDVDGWFKNTRQLVDDRIGHLFATSCLLNVLWLQVWFSDWDHRYALGLVVLSLLAITVGAIAYRVDPTSRGVNVCQERTSEMEGVPLLGDGGVPLVKGDPILVRAFVRLPFAIYFGWLFCAWVVNVFIVFFPIDATNPGATVPYAQAAFIFIGLFAVAIAVKFRDVAVTFVAIWAMSSVPSSGVVSRYPEQGFTIKYTAVWVSSILAFLVVIVVPAHVIVRHFKSRQASAV